MIKQLRVQKFKSWKDTETMRLAPLTGLFGANSSGKTAILQLLLMMKQTVESTDRSRILHTGDERTYTDLGTFVDLVFRHDVPASLTIELGWSPTKPIKVFDPEKVGEKVLFNINDLTFESTIRGDADSIAVERFQYRFTHSQQSYCFGMSRQSEAGSNVTRPEYELISSGYETRRARGKPWPLPAPVKCYGFPDRVNASYQNLGFLADLVLAFEELFQGIYYLGPLREYPHRIYQWAGDQPQDVGKRGEQAISALLAARARGMTVSTGPRKRRRNVDERVAEWLKELKLIHEFELRAIAENRRDYELRVQRSRYAPSVLITDVGFGVSQILPVLVLCYYAPEGSTLILEQPEIHLHPAVQAGLADVFIDVIKTRDIQIILESHSEHLLRRLQRRVAEGMFTPDQAALYFTRMDQGQSQMDHLQLDLYGNIANWPDGFFGDELGELTAMTLAAMDRKLAEASG